MEGMKNKKRTATKKRSEMWYHLMVFPGLFFLILFSYIPMVGVIMAFQDFVPAKGLFRSEFVGLKHFIYMFQLPDIGKIIRNTVVIALGKMIFGMILAIAFAILLNEIRIKFMDGASWWKRVWNVTIPGMMPIILLMTAMNLTSILSAGFDQIYNLYSPIVYETGDVLDTYVYRIGLVGRQYSFGAAVGLCRSIVGMALLLSANALTKKLTDQKIF